MTDLRKRVAEALIGMVRAKANGDGAEKRSWMAEARKNLELRARLGQIVGDGTRVQVEVDARKQLAVLANLGEDDLRALARGDVRDLEPAAAESGAGELLVNGSAIPAPVRDAQTPAVTQTSGDAA